ncbi:MAG: energy-coupling factor transporter transmembrane protein EcfT [Bifidobacteriaceae bacterium]|nr:energy-coupling factor transporter transmembrane protein EcfT [Bifidobacteriaceae bacterium]
MELDPRTKLALTVVVSGAVMSPPGLMFVPAGMALAVGLALAERAWRRGAALTLTGGVLWFGGWLAPAWFPHPLTAIASLACAFGIRLVPAAGVGLHLMATTSPTRLAAGLRAVKAPRVVAVPLAVMLRFFPVVASEAAAVLDAMRLRGLAGAGGLIRHPLRSVERFTVPMIAASLRATEDLSASALLRGLGSTRRPSALHPPRLGWADAVAGVALAALAAGALAAPPWLT